MDQPRPLSMTDAFSAAWLRTKVLLFRPFRLELWLTVGFAAFLAHLGSNSGGGSGLRFENFWDGGDSWSERWSHGGRGLVDTWNGMDWHPWMIILAGFLTLLGLLLAVLFLWLSSRGQFIFLDNLVTRRGEVRAPWQKYGALGDSLFRWQLVFTLICLAAFGGLALLAMVVLIPLGLTDLGNLAALPAVMLLGTLLFLMVVSMAYIDFFLMAFVVPIMHRHGLSATQAWARFITLFKEHSGTFVLFGIFYFLVGLVGGLVLAILGLMSCCVGLLLMAIPYVGSVVTLPLTVLQRYLTVEFLGRFGPDWDLLGPVPDDPDHRSIYGDGDGTVVGPQDLGQDAGPGQPGPEVP